MTYFRVGAAGSILRARDVREVSLHCIAGHGRGATVEKFKAAGDDWRIKMAKAFEREKVWSAGEPLWTCRAFGRRAGRAVRPMVIAIRIKCGSHDRDRCEKIARNGVV